jgi:hypothetical protein
MKVVKCCQWVGIPMSKGLVGMEGVDWATKKLICPKIPVVKNKDKQVIFMNLDNNLQLRNYLVERQLKLKDYGIMVLSDEPKQPRHRM